MLRRGAVNQTPMTGLAAFNNAGAQATFLSLWTDAGVGASNQWQADRAKEKNN